MLTGGPAEADLTLLAKTQVGQTHASTHVRGAQEGHFLAPFSEGLCEGINRWACDKMYVFSVRKLCLSLLYVNMLVWLGDGIFVSKLWLHQMSPLHPPTSSSSRSELSPAMSSTTGTNWGGQSQVTPQIGAELTGCCLSSSGGERSWRPVSGSYGSLGWRVRKA